MSERAQGRLGLALWVSLGLCTAAAFWISSGVTPFRSDRMNVWHHYEYLADGFLHGHTYLSVDPAPELAKLKDPYDPAANAPYRLWDATYFKGRYYLYFGPTPVIPFLIWRVATGSVLPQNLAVALFAALGIAGLSRLLWEVRGRCFPALSNLTLALIFVTVFHASWIPVTLRRSGVWDLPIVAAIAFCWWSVYGLWKFHDSGGKTRWAVATGLSLALLMGSRVTFVLGAAVLALMLLARAGEPGRRWRQAFLGAAIAAAGGIALLAYNHARFGSWTEFGLRYVLFGEDYRGVKYFGGHFLPFDAHAYLLSLPQFGPYFPFLHPFWTDATPQGFVGFEEVYGMLFMVPVQLAAFAAFAWAHRQDGSPHRGPVVLALSGAVALSASAGIILLCWAWVTSRYADELFAGWTVATAVGLMAIFGTEGAARPGRTVRVLAAVAAVWSIAATWLASAEFRGFMAVAQPRTYAALAHALDYPSLWLAKSRSAHFGPVDLEVSVPHGDGPVDTVLLASGREQRLNQLILRRRDARHASLILVENEHIVLETPDLDTSEGKLRFRLAAPWLYPPPAHPYWDSVNPADRADLQALFSVSWGSGSNKTHSTHSADPVAFEPSVRWQSLADPGTPYVDSMKPSAETPR